MLQHTGFPGIGVLKHTLHLRIVSSRAGDVLRNPVRSSRPDHAFSTGELRHLCAVREHYQHTRDLFSTRAMAYLRFLRWLYHTGRVVP